MNLETPFAQVLDTNYTPSAPERDTLQSLIRKPQEMILELDEEISRLQAKREELQCFVKRHRALLSPFRRLPEDVWRMIFSECLPNNKLGVCTRTLKEAPLLLTTICCSWRKIALSTPSLWNSIHIFIPFPSAEIIGETYVSHMRARIAGFREWLDRSGSLPITISVSSHDVPPRPARDIETTQLSWEQAFVDPYQTLSREFIELLAQYSRRWRTLAFGYAMPDLSRFDSLTTTDLVSLQNVHSFGRLFRFQHGFGAAVPGPAALTDPSPLASLLSRTPSLRELGLVGEWISAEAFSFPIGWSRLTKLSILYSTSHLLTPGQIIHTLAKQCHLLAMLSLEISHIDRNHDEVLPPRVEWTSLQDLSISFKCNYFEPDMPFPPSDQERATPTLLPVITHTFSTVIFPSLTRFSIRMDERYYPYNRPVFDTTPFEALLSSSRCPLVHLEITCPRYFTVEALLRVLRPLDSLTSLELGHAMSTRTFTQGFHTGDAPSNRCHHWCSELLQATKVEGLCLELEDLNLRGCYVDEVDDILSFAIQRPRLRALRAAFGRVSSRAMKQLLEPREEAEMLQERGVKRAWSYTEDDTRKKTNDKGSDGMPGLTSWW